MSKDEADALISLGRAIRQREERIELLVGLLRELYDDDLCSYDHHGYCQTHGLSLRPCIMERVRNTIGWIDDE